MGLISQRAGRVHVRVGGNTQETAVLVASLPGGVAISKDKADSSNPVSSLKLKPSVISSHTIIFCC